VLLEFVAGLHAAQQEQSKKAQPTVSDSPTGLELYKKH
jgi:hypothetical protein